MMDLPEEMIMHILEFSNDKMCISMTSKIFWKRCKKVYDGSDNLNMNDPYDVNKFYCKKNILMRQTDIKYMFNHKCLNCIFHKFFVGIDGNIIDIYKSDKRILDFWDSDTDEEDNYEVHKKNMTINANFVYALLHQYCITNNISNLEYLGTLIKYLHPSYISNYNRVEELEDLITISFMRKSYDILMILMTDYSIRAQWPKSLCHRYGSKELISPIIDEIKFMHENYIFTPLDIYKLFKSDRGLIIDDLIYQHLEKYINPATFNYLKINKKLI